MAKEWKKRKYEEEYNKVQRGPGTQVFFRFQRCICLLCDNVISQFKRSKHPRFSTDFQKGGELKAEKFARLKQNQTA